LKAIYLVHDTEKVLNKTYIPNQKHTYYMVWVKGKVKGKVKAIPVQALKNPGC